MRRRPLLGLCLVLLSVLTGCSREVDCFEMGAAECQRVARAATSAVPLGHTWLHVTAAPGRGDPSYHAFACYPDGTQVVVEVTLIGGGERVQPLEGVELASCRR